MKTNTGKDISLLTQTYYLAFPLLETLFSAYYI